MGAHPHPVLHDSALANAAGGRHVANGSQPGRAVAAHGGVGEGKVLLDHVVAPMPTILESWTDIAGEDYTDFLDMAVDWFGFFSLMWRDSRSFDESAVQIRRDLDRHETNRRRASHWPGTRICDTKKPVATIVSFRLDSASRLILARPGSLFAWRDPAYPEDLAFYQQDGRLAFATCAHERMAWAIDLDFGYSLPKHLDFTAREINLDGDGGFEYVANPS